MISQQLNVITSDIQTSVMQTRMCPVGTIFTRFNRVVREIARHLEKVVKLEIIGSEVELDKSIIEAIADPMTHLIRNAVDHGIEAPDKRRKAGKNPQGYLELSAFHQEGQVNIQIKDDGKGMDPKILKEKAIETNLITKEVAEVMPDREAFNLIFEAGFSTANTITDVSGRGVGMDVVKSSFQRLGGSVDISSIVGRGTTITIKLPLTLAIMPALIFSVEESFYAIPQVNIIEVVWLHGPEVYQSINLVDDKEIYWLRGKPIPLLRLSNILDIPKTYVEEMDERTLSDRRTQKTDRRKEGESGESRKDERRAGEVERRVSLENSLYIIVVRVGNERVGLAVDKVIDTEELVVKPLHDQLKDCGAFAGTAVLGDSRIAMILDIAAISQLGALQFANVGGNVAGSRTAKDEQQTVLLFDIGGEELFALPLCLINRVQEIHRNEIKIANDREYLDFRGQLIPLIRPEAAVPAFTSVYQEDCIFLIIPKCRKPIGIVVANILDTVELDCQIDSDTIHQETIIGSRFINGKLALFMDAFSLIEKVEPNWFLADKVGGQSLMNILLVEDSVFYQTLFSSYLRGSGVSIITASNGVEALELMEKNAFDGVISDIEMPGMDGFEFARIVRKNKQFRDLPLLAISAAEEAVMRPLAIESGFNDFKSKLIPEELLETLKSFVHVK
jgi:two-component system chemotaxis sensor kinase CheA